MRRSFGGWIELGTGLALLLAAVPVARGQYDALNVTLYRQISLGDFGGANNGNDCWGYVSGSGREYALMGLSNRVAFVDITVPANPVIVGSINHNSSLWADIKVYQDYAYVVNESGGGIQVIDMSDIDNGNINLVRTVSSPSTTHNIVINEASGFAYSAGPDSDGGGLIAFDLSDPTNPARRGVWRDAFVHDAHVITYTSGPYDGREIAFGFCGQSALYVIDVTDKANMFTISQQTYPGQAYTHQGWTSDDGQYLFVNDELDEIYGNTCCTRTLVFDISDLTNPTLVNTFTNGLPTPDHNLYVKGGFVFEANYTSGLRIWDVADPLAPVEVGYFDTYPNGNPRDFGGAWSTYPYFPSGTVIVSDMQRGLFILDVSDALGGLQFTLPNGLPDLLDPSGGTTVRVEVAARGSEPQPGTGMLHYDAGNGFESIRMEEVGDNVYDAVFPALPCGGLVPFYFSAENMDGQTFTDPAGAPGTFYSALAALGEDVSFADDFETDRGWTVQNENLSDGAWQRGRPAGDGDRGDPIQDYDGSGQCYLTGNRAGNSDVDGGPTRLMSPVFDLTAGDAFIEYALWLFNDDGDDTLDVDISNDDGASWTRVESVGNTPGWRLDRIRVSQYVEPTALMRLRFSVADNPNNSVTEAGVDAIRVLVPICGVLGCDDVKRFKAACKNNGTVKVKVVMVDRGFSGRTVVVSIDDTPHELTIEGRKAKLKICCFIGSHTIALDEPADCPGSPIVVDCP